MKTILKLHYNAVPSAIEELYVNESIDIKHSEGTLQRTIVVDANKERLSVSFDVRKFDGPSDYCGYGGIRMFNHVKSFVAYDLIYKKYEALIQIGNIRRKYYKQFVIKSKYFPICTNDSLIFERKFYLDFGKTYFVFYDFNSMWNIDVSLHVHPSPYIAIHNFEQSYCGGEINRFIFNDFIINCALRLVKLKRQVSFVLQWLRDSSMIFQREKPIDIEGIWPGIMDLTITQNFRNVRTFDLENQLCRSAKVLLVTDLVTVTLVPLGQHTRKQSIPNAESLMIQRPWGNCPHLDQGSHVIILTPSSSQRDGRCISIYNNFSSKHFTTSGNIKYQSLTKGCISLKAAMTVGMYQLNFIEPLYNFPIANKWMYYSIAISKRCYSGSGMKIYFQSLLFKENQAFYFNFAQQRSHYIFYDYGITSTLYFHLERFRQECKADVEFTTLPYTTRGNLKGNRAHFKVLIFILSPTTYGNGRF